MVYVTINNSQRHLSSHTTLVSENRRLMSQPMIKFCFMNVFAYIEPTLRYKVYYLIYGFPKLSQYMHTAVSSEPMVLQCHNAKSVNWHCGIVEIHNPVT